MEKEYENIHTNIIAVTIRVEEETNIFDDYFEKPLNKDRIFKYIQDHFKTRRTDLEGINLNKP